MKHAWIAWIAIVACKRSEHHEASPPVVAPPAPVVEKPAETDRPSSVRVDAAGLARLLPPTVGMPLPLAAVHPGDTDAEARKLLPAEAFGSWAPPGFDGMEIRVAERTVVGVASGKDFEVRTVAGGDVILPAKTASALVASRWGKPTIVGTREVWFDPTSGMRATVTDSSVLLGDARLEISAYLTLDRLVGEAPDRFAFEPQRFVGMPAADAVAVMPPSWIAHASDAFFSVELPPTETDDGPTIALFDVENGRITRVRLSIPIAFRERAAAMIAKKGSRFTIADTTAADLVVDEQ